MVGLDFISKKAGEVYEHLYTQSLITNVGSQGVMVGAQLGLRGLAEKQAKDEVGKTPMSKLKKIARDFDNSLNTPENSLRPREIKMTLKGGMGEFDPEAKRVYSNPDPSTFGHELGHAYNSGTERGRRRQNRYGAGTPKQRKAAAYTKMGGLGLNITENPDETSVASILAGAASELLDPQNMTILKEEASAWKRGRDYAIKAGAKFNPRMAITAFGTYPTAMLARGVQQGVYGWIAGQTVDKGLKATRDFIIDPILHRLIPELAPEESALEKYGYNRNDYRFTGDLESGNWKLDKRFGKR